MIALIAAAAVVAHTAAVKDVAVRDDFFSPKAVTVSKGAKVRWGWKGKSVHNVSVTSGPAKFRSDFKTSGSYTRKLTKKGTYRILCTVHAPSMKMTIKVK